MSKNKCPCCGITILGKEEEKKIQTVRSKDVSLNSAIILKPEGMSDKVWERFVKGYSLRLITK
jgi:hypothetical protein